MDTSEATTSPVPCSSLETLEHQITELSAHIHAANYRLLCLIAEFDRRQEGGAIGASSAAPTAHINDTGLRVTYAVGVSLSGLLG